MPRRSRVPANRPIAAANQALRHWLGRVGVHRGLDRAAQIKQPLFDQDRHVADIGCRLPPILENAGLPRQLVDKRVVLRLIGVWLVLHVAQLLGFLAYLLGHRLLLARKTLDAVHHLVALGVELRIERGEQRLRLFLLFLVGSGHEVRDQFPRVLDRRAARGQARDEVGCRSHRSAWCRSGRSAGPVQTLAIEIPGTFNCWQGQSG